MKSVRSRDEVAACHAAWVSRLVIAMRKRRVEVKVMAGRTAQESRGGIEFLGSEGLAQMDAPFEEEYRASADYGKIGRACGGDCNASAQSVSWQVHFPDTIK